MGCITANFASSFTFRFVAVTVSCIAVLRCGAAANGECGFPALFSFGDSLSDTGNGVLRNPLFRSAVQLPYGETYFGRPEGRFCDGRVLLDFLAESVGLPLLKPYLAYKTAGTDFSLGINYASAGATVQGPGALLLRGDIAFLSVDSLDVQLGWHLAIHKAAQSPEIAASSYPGVTLPSPNAFADALYFIEIGANDYGSYFLSKYLIRPGQRGMDIDNSYALSNLVPAVVQKLVGAVEDLYANSARNFFILSLYPNGCASLFLKLLNGTKDAQGCLSALNQVFAAHNQQITAAADDLRSKYPDINVMVADGESPYIKALQNPPKYGLSRTLDACCGAGPTVPYQFSLRTPCSSSTYVCANPSSYVLWDGIHLTEAMNRYILNSIVSGEYLNPPNRLACASII